MPDDREVERKLEVPARGLRGSWTQYFCAERGGETPRNWFLSTMILSWAAPF